MTTFYFWSRKSKAGLQMKDENGKLVNIRKGGSTASGCRWPREVAKLLGTSDDWQNRQRFDIPNEQAQNVIAAAIRDYHYKKEVIHTAQSLGY